MQYFSGNTVEQKQLEKCCDGVAMQVCSHAFNPFYDGCALFVYLRKAVFNVFVLNVVGLGHFRYHVMRFRDGNSFTVIFEGCAKC